MFASPSATPIVEVCERVDRGAGVLLVYGNYEGDVMNFEMAAELLAERGIEARHLPVTDDLASAPPEERGRRRGVAGDVFVLKVAGARADEGASLDEVHASAAHGQRPTRTIGVGLGPCTVPGGRTADVRAAGGHDGRRHGRARRSGPVAARRSHPPTTSPTSCSSRLLGELEPGLGRIRVSCSSTRSGRRR